MDSKNTQCAFPIEEYSIDTEFGWWRPCPRVPYQKLEDLDFGNHDAAVQLRKDLRNGVKNELCKGCWYAQDNGAKSYRQVMGRDYKHDLIASDRLVPMNIELKFSNLCNLRCIMCNSKCSSLWEDEQPLSDDMFGSVRGKEVSEKVLQYIDDNYDQIKIIRMFGGEPVLHKQFNDVFDLILSKPDGAKKEISFSTNMFYNETYRKKFEDNMMKCYEMGHTFFFRFSIDGVGDQGEYVRENMNWKRFEENLISFLDKFAHLPNFGRIRCNIALNVTNIVYLDKIMQYIDDLGYDIVEPHYNYVANPEHFYVMTYGDRLNKALDLIYEQDYRKFGKYKKHVIELLESMAHMEPDLEAIQKGKEWLDKYDIRTGRNFLETFPLNEFMYD